MGSSLVLIELFGFAFLQLFFLVTTATLDYSCQHGQSWLLNNVSVNVNFGLKTGIQSSRFSSIVSDTWIVETYGIPNYSSYLLTTADISTLNNRPRKSTEFISGATSAVRNMGYNIGDDVGYTRKCSLGYWPPNLPCVSTTLGSRSLSISLLPKYEASSSGCYAQSLSVIGYWISGAAIYSATSGRSYKSESVWHVVDAFLESSFDLDVCGGRAESTGVYIHKQYSKCLAARVGDTGGQHSPIYGWMLDGFPIHGPFQDDSFNTAQSCWKTRNYASGMLCKK
jgi:hypothetical protein